MYTFISSPFQIRSSPMLCAGLSLLLASCGGGSGTDAASGTSNPPDQLSAVITTSATTNLALHKTVSASSVESASLPASAAVDGNATTRWSSQWNAAPQWLTVDLGAATSVNHVVLSWENSYAKSFQIQTSTDGVTWQTVFNTTAGTGGTQDIKFSAVNARYVKMYATLRAFQWGYSLYEFMVYNDASATPVPTPTPVPVPAGTRDPMKWPFAATSIWNMPIGSGAVYAPANLSASFGSGGGLPQIDDEQIILKPTSPLTAINYSSAGWTGANRCAATGGLLVSVPMPASYVVPNGSSNSSGTFLAADARTLIQTQPLARCSAGGPATSLVTFAAVDIYGDGIKGSHGGSGMSAIGGSIRIGELRPGSQGPKHALKVNVYAKQALYQCKTSADCFRWPAVTADSYAVGFYGTNGGNANTAMKMGALLAIPASKDLSTLGLETAPGKQLAWTLQNYGAYIVDDTWGPNFAINAESGPDGSMRSQFQADWGYSIEMWGSATTPWARDIQRLILAVSVVNNNSPSTIGGGGTPRQPIAPAFQ